MLAVIDRTTHMPCKWLRPFMAHAWADTMNAALGWPRYWVR